MKTRFASTLPTGRAAHYSKGNGLFGLGNHYGDRPIVVKRIRENKLIHLELDSQDWGKTAGHGYKVDVFFEMEPLDDGSTMLSISEQGWPTDESGLKGSHENCSGWTHAAMCLKAYVEHGISQRFSLRPGWRSEC